MSLIYERDTDIKLVATFLNRDSSEATITGNPTVTVWHIINGASALVINAANMTQLSGSIYYYEYHVPAGASKGDYIVKYSATYSDTTNVVGTEVFTVIDRKAFAERASGGGIVKNIRMGVWDKDEKERILKQIVDLINEIAELKTSLLPLEFGSIRDMAKNNSIGLYKSIEDAKFDSATKIIAESSVHNKAIQAMSEKIDIIIGSLAGKISDLGCALAELKNETELNSKMLAKCVPDGALESMLTEIEDKK